MRLLLVGATGLALCLAACTQGEQKAAVPAPAAAAGPTLEGVWKRVETVVADGEQNAGTHTTDVQPSLYIFTKTHYSINAVTTYAPRPALSEKPTEAEQAAAFTPFTANAGTYSLAGTTLTIAPVAAKNPATMSGEQPPSPITIEWAGEDVWFIQAAASGAKNRSRLTRVSD